MRIHYMAILGLIMVVSGAVALGGPVRSGSKTGSPQIVQRLTPDHFRCIVVGDSQTTGPNGDRIRTQFHQWDAPIVGELITVGNPSTGYVVNNSNAGIANLSYSGIDLDGGWLDGGPNDFFAALAARWTCLGDIQSIGWRVGRYRLRFGSGNNQAAWNQAWGIGKPLVAKIAVRTGPMCVDFVETVPERGGVSSFSNRRVHKLKKTWGVQIIEQPIPVDINPGGDDVGVGLFFPGGSIEKSGQVLEVLGVVIERVDELGRSLRGTIVGYQGRGGWNIEDHLSKLSFASRVALVEMTGADSIMIMLGHNQESGGQQAIASNMQQLVAQWEAAYVALGRDRPSIIYITPWAIISDSASPYMLEMESVMRGLALQNRKDVFVSFLPGHNYLRPDVFDPMRYQLDHGGVHPGNVPTAERLSEDLYKMLFGGG